MTSAGRLLVVLLLLVSAGTGVVDGAPAPQRYSDADGDTPVTAGAGTIVYTLTMPVQPNNALIPFTSNSVNAIDDDVVSWGANTLNVRAVITGITGSPTHARLRASGNLT